MGTSASREMKPRQFWAMCFSPFDEGVPTHVRVPPQRYLGVFIVGTAAELHGPQGCCTCCPRAAEITDREAS